MGLRGFRLGVEGWASLTWASESFMRVLVVGLLVVFMALYVILDKLQEGFWV